MSRHNFLQRRARLLAEMREASDAYLWFCNKLSPQARRATTLAAKRLMRCSRDLWKLGTL